MPSATYTALSQRYATVFEDILRGERARETGRHLPLAALRQLQDHGLGAITVPVAAGGDGAQYQTVLRVLMDLAAVDANLAHIWRSHLVFVEYIRLIRHADQRQRWWQRLVDGQWGGSALSARHNPTEQHDTVITRDSAGVLRITGDKSYTTGTLAAEWTAVSAVLEPDVAAAVLRRRRRAGDAGLTLDDVAHGLAFIRVRQPRVQVKDDWDGFGQRMTATGSMTMRDAGVEELIAPPEPHSLVAVFQEATLAALMAGIGRAALRDGVELLRDRTRIFNTSTGELPRHDSQLLGIIGELSAQLAGAEELVRAVGRELDAHHLEEALLSAQRASVMVPKCVLDVSTRIFDTLGASATSTRQELDRHWRNARTLATHDPTVFKERMLGDWEVNGVLPVPYRTTTEDPQAALRLEDRTA